MPVALIGAPAWQPSRHVSAAFEKLRRYKRMMFRRRPARLLLAWTAKGRREEAVTWALQRSPRTSPG